MTGLGLGDPGFKSTKWQRIFLSETSGLALRPIQWFFFQAVKRPQRGDDLSTSSSVEVKTDWNYPSTFPILVFLQGVAMDNFIF